MGRGLAATGPSLLGRSAADPRDHAIVTGSSDYHGSGKPNLPGENTTADEMVARIIAQATGTPPRSP